MIITISFVLTKAKDGAWGVASTIPIFFYTDLLTKLSLQAINSTIAHCHTEMTRASRMGLEILRFSQNDKLNDTLSIRDCTVKVNSKIIVKMKSRFTIFSKFVRVEYNLASFNRFCG